MLEVDIRQLLLFAIAFFVPVFLIIRNREQWLLAWVCFTCGINIFDTTIIVNLAATRIVGLLLIPQALGSLPSLIRSKPTQAVIAGFICLILTGVAFGFLFPWPKGGLDASFNQIAQGRTVIYLVRTAADISLSFFVARQIIKWKCSDKILIYLLMGTSIAALGGIIEFVSRVDIYGNITGLTSMAPIFRMRGFNAEPRFLGLIAVYGFSIAILMWTYRLTWTRLGLVALHAAAIFMAGSASAGIALVAGAFALNFFDKRVRTASAIVLLLCSLMLVVFVVTDNPYLEYYCQHSKTRLSGDRYDLSSNDLFHNLAYRTEIFDVAALMFLAENPIYLLSGTGPGLIPISATPYAPRNFSWLFEAKGVNSPPTMGLLLEVSNIGVMGLLLWCIICVSSVQAFSRLARYCPDERDRWLRMRAAFMAGAAIYAVQASPLSGIWPLFIGTGIGAVYLVRAENVCPRKSLSMTSNTDFRRGV